MNSKKSAEGYYAIILDKTKPIWSLVIGYMIDDNILIYHPCDNNLYDKLVYDHLNIIYFTNFTDTESEEIEKKMLDKVVNLNYRYLKCFYK